MPERFAYFFQSFSHPSRNKLLRILGEQGELSVEHLAAATDITDSTVSRHLSALRLQRVVKVRRDGQRHYYSLDREHIDAAFRNFLTFLDGTPAVEDIPPLSASEPDVTRRRRPRPS